MLMENRAAFTGVAITPDKHLSMDGHVADLTE
jgi:hypothetical protein